MKKVYISSIIFISLFCLASFTLADVTITNPLCPAGQTQAGNPTTCTENFVGLLDKIITGVAELVASLSVIMIIIAGILYLTSAGSPERIGTAKKALIYAIIGIVIAIAAKSIAIIIKTTLGVTS